MAEPRRDDESDSSRAQEVLGGELDDGPGRRLLGSGGGDLCGNAETLCGNAETLCGNAEPALL
jgi:hypothetical protein